MILFIVFNTNLFCQNIIFRELDNPDNYNNMLYKVQLFSTGEALFSGENIDLYSDGENISVLPGENKGGLFSAIERNGIIYALSIKNDTCMYYWNDSIKRWNRINIQTPTWYKFSTLYIISPEEGLFIGDNLYEDSISIWKVNIKDSSFILIKSFCNIDNNLWFSVIGPRENDVLIIQHDSKTNLTALLSYDYDSVISVIDYFPYVTDRWSTIDNNVFYFLSGDSRDSLTKWNSTTLEKELVCSNSSLSKYCLSMFIIGNNDFILTGDGIARLNIVSKEIEEIRPSIGPFGYMGSSYNKTLNKAIIIGNYNGQIFEMSLVSNINESSDDLSIIKIYPNPTNDKINIEGYIGTIDIFNIFNQRMGTFSSDFIDISGYPAGIYFIKINNEVKKIMKY